MNVCDDDKIIIFKRSGYHSECKIHVLFQMFRHGDRSAIGMIPSDIYNVSSWPMGPGELTPVSNTDNGVLYFILPTTDVYCNKYPII